MEPEALAGLEQMGEVDFAAISDEPLPTIDVEGTNDGLTSEGLTDEGLTSDELTMEDELAIENIPVEEMDDLDASLAEIDAETPAATEGCP